MSREGHSQNQIQDGSMKQYIQAQTTAEDENEEYSSLPEQSLIEYEMQNANPIPHEDGVEYGAGNALKEFKRTEDDTRKEAIPPTDKIRLVLLGQAEAGKSTLISRVFDVPEEKANVSHDRAGVHDIRDGKTYPQNPGIVVHDSGGIEGGDDKAVKVINEFLQEYSTVEFLKDQIHCIWYCIPLSKERPLDKFDLRFLNNLSSFVGAVPVIVIFTKFDRLVAKHKDILSRQRPRLADARLDETAEAKASQEFETRYLKAMHDATRKYPKRIPYVRVGRMQKYELGGAEHGDQENETNTQGLIKMVDEIVDERLRLIWASVQRGNADSKIQSSVKAGMKFFTATASANAIPLLPGKDFAVEGIVFSKLFNSIHGIWNRDNVLYQRNKTTKKLFIEAVFDEHIIGHVASAAFNVVDIIGPLSQSRNTVKFMKVLAGLTLLHEQLFWRQKTIFAEKSQVSVAEGRGLQGAGAEDTQPLSDSEVRMVVNKFREGGKRNSLRKDMCAQIDGRLAKAGVNWFKSFSSSRIEELIFDSLRIARKYNPSWDYKLE